VKRPQQAEADAEAARQAMEAEQAQEAPGTGAVSGRLASMTGYRPRHLRGSRNKASFACEIKSVNGRGLDIRLRLAPGSGCLESDIRQLIGKSLSRGSVTLQPVSIEREGAGGELLVNQQALATVLAALSQLSTMVDATRPSLDGILALKGVLEQRDRPLSADGDETLAAALLDAVAVALGDLVVARRQEGERIAAVLLERIDEIGSLVARAEAHPSRKRDVILSRLRLQVAELAGEVGGLSEDRLAQEALLLATKADIREELDRLVAHIASARQADRIRRCRRPPAGFPGAGIQSRGQYALLQVQRSGADRHRP
jgi:uncharacterized protein (TIGR00255 family)